MMLKDAIAGIKPLAPALGDAAQRRLDSLTKPQGSLGRLEEFAKRMVQITGDTMPEIPRKVIFTFAADHGVADEGVSAFPREVTRQMVQNFLSGGAGINVLSRHVGAEVVVVDMGVAHDFSPQAGLVIRKAVHGTRNMLHGPAMSRDEAMACIEAGISLAREHAAFGIFGAGEMGIGNTTPSAAIASVMTGLSVAEVTGRGTGITDETLKHKISVIERSIALNNPDASDPIDVLAKVGGAEIGGIAGLCLGAAAMGRPVVVDGFISTAGALIAWALAPASAQYMFAAHRSVEAGHTAMLRLMGLRPMVEFDMRLGEGTGAALGMGLIDAGLKIYREMATFESASVSQQPEPSDVRL